MTDPIDWSLTTWEGNRLRQHREFLALPFREKMRWLEELARTAERLQQLPVDPTPVDEPPPEEPR
jgi:hypothetical protein